MNTSYWVASTPPTEYPALEGDADADVAVIGGGIVGLSVAHALARRGVGRVAVLERGACGGGSTSKATGGIRCQFGSEVNVRLSLRCVDELPEHGQSDPFR